MDRRLMPRFLDLYQENECLWDPSNADYRNRLGRDRALRNIIDSMNLNMSLADVKTKIKSIRTVYKRELNNVKKSIESGDEPIYEPNLVWFKQAYSFLRTVSHADLEDSSKSDEASKEDDGDDISNDGSIDVPLNELCEETPTVETLDTSSKKRKSQDGETPTGFIPRRHFRWSDGTMFQFIELYRQNKALWDPSCEDYRNRLEKDTAIQRINDSLNLDMTHDEIKNKIKSLRTIYRKELNLIEKSKKNGDKRVYEPRLIWFRQAHEFLKNVSFYKVPEDGPSDVKHTTKDPVVIKTEYLDEIDDDGSIDAAMEESNEYPQSSTSPIIEFLEIPPKKWKADSDNEEIADEDEKPFESRMDSLDEFDHFGCLIAAQLRKLPEYEAMMCQDEINKIIRKFRMRLIKRKHSRNNLPSSTSTMKP